jgi:hypothetical protein
MVACAAALAACSGGGLGTGGPDGGGPRLVGKSPGRTTFQLVIPADKSYCDQSSTCASNGHITILDASGRAVTLGIPWCSTICSSACMPSPCPGIACLEQGFPVKSTSFDWDGSAFATSTCGAKMDCYQPGFAAAGSYVARFCATPGTLSSDGGAPQTCTATGPIACVDVAFDFPSATPVVGQLP